MVDAERAVALEPAQPILQHKSGHEHVPVSSEGDAQEDKGRIARSRAPVPSNRTLACVGGHDTCGSGLVQWSCTGADVGLCSPFLPEELERPGGLGPCLPLRDKRAGVTP